MKYAKNEKRKFLNNNMKFQEKINQIKKEWFSGISSYNAFIYACNLGSIVNSYIDKGYLLLANGEAYEGRFVLDVDGNNSTIGLKQGNCTFVHCGCTHDDDELCRIYATKKMVDECFNEIELIPSKSRIKLSRLKRMLSCK